jgi:hypothetical protein
MEVSELFEKHDEEYHKFDRILPSERYSNRNDLCAFMYLDKKFDGTGDIVGAAEHDIIYLDGNAEELTEDDVIYLLRCGVLYGDDSLYMNV